MEANPEILYSLFGLLQVIILGLGGWALTTVIRVQSRLVKLETLLEASIIEDIKDLKQRIRKIEKQ